jgi:hypothetical protein
MKILYILKKIFFFFFDLVAKQMNEHFLFLFATYSHH